jgi:hypothetical protein
LTVAVRLTVAVAGWYWQWIDVAVAVWQCGWVAVDSGSVAGWQCGWVGVGDRHLGNVLLDRRWVAVD